MFYFIINKDIAFFDNNKTGELLSRILNDTAVVQDGLSTNVSILLKSIIEITVILGILFIISWKLTFVTLGTVEAIVMIAVIFNSCIKGYSEAM